jgi:methionine-rich copper-binding protein CopC
MKPLGLPRLLGMQRLLGFPGLLGLQRLAGVFLSGLLLAGLAGAHAKLRSTVPAADAQLSAAPKVLTLTFNEDVRLAVLTLSNAGKNIPLTLDRSAAAAPQVSVPLPPLSPGKYQVQWSALSPDDGHVVKGSYSFTIS